jgi:hypothetical protein
MGIFRASKLREEVKRHGADVVIESLSEGLDLHREKKTGGIAPEEFSIRALAEAFIPDGREFIEEAYQGGVISESAVNTTAFSNITGQIMFTKVLEAYQNPGFVFSNLVPTVPTRFSGEKLPGITSLGELDSPVKEGHPIPEVGIEESYIETPETEKRGNILSVTLEAVYFDRTNLILQRANGVGDSLGLNKEKRIIRVAVGATNNYRRNGTTLNTYLTSGGWVNDHSNQFTDWTSVDKAMQLFANMVDPDNGESIVINPNSIVVSQAKAFTANRFLNATEVRHKTDSGNLETVSANPIGGMLTSYVSQLMRNEIVSKLSVSSSNADQYWLMGDFAKAFAYMQNWPLQYAQERDNSAIAFTHDIIARFKVTERGVAAVMDPRYVVRNKN